LGSLESKPPINHVEEISRGLSFVTFPLCVIGYVSDHIPKDITEGDNRGKAYCTWNKC